MLKSNIKPVAFVQKRIMHQFQLSIFTILLPILIVRMESSRGSASCFDSSMTFAVHQFGQYNQCKLLVVFSVGF